MTASPLIIALLASQLAGKTLSIDGPHSAVQFHVTHKLHKVDGRATTVDGKAAIGPDGKVLAMVRIPVMSLDSGDANRDANMRDVLEVARYPFIVYKGITSVPPTLAPGSSVDVTLKGELDLHGVKRPIDVPAHVEVAPDGAVRLHGAAEFSLDAFKIERPSLLLVKLEDDCRIQLDVVLREGKM